MGEDSGKASFGREECLERGADVDIGTLVTDVGLFRFLFCGKIVVLQTQCSFVDQLIHHSCRDCVSLTDHLFPQGAGRSSSSSKSRDIDSFSFFICSHKTVFIRARITSSYQHRSSTASRFE
jgi:hypothetical protein